MSIILGSVSLVLAIAWHFVAVYFWKSWRKRKSPLSLAICALTGYPIFINANSIIFLHQDRELSVALMVGANFILLVNFAICFKWQKRAFSDSRSRAPKGTPNGVDERLLPPS